MKPLTVEQRRMAERYAAAQDLVRASDMLREVARSNRARQVDLERVRLANQKWSAVRCLGPVTRC